MTVNLLSDFAKYMFHMKEIILIMKAIHHPWKGGGASSSLERRGFIIPGKEGLHHPWKGGAILKYSYTKIKQNKCMKSDWL